MKQFAWFALPLLVAMSPAAALQPTETPSRYPGDPAAVRIVTTDIGNFWHAFEAAQRSDDPWRTLDDSISSARWSLFHQAAPITAIRCEAWHAQRTTSMSAFHP